MSDDDTTSGDPTGNVVDGTFGDTLDDTAGETIDETVDETLQALAEARARLADVPAEVVILNHTMGLYELAAIHLSSAPPNLTAAALAIDAVSCLVEGLGDRLGSDVETMRSALTNIQMAFVQVRQTTESD